MLQKCVLRSSPFRSFTFPMTPPPSQRKVLSMAWWEWTTATCVPPSAVRAFIKTLRDKTQNTGSVSTEPAYSISRSHSPTRSGDTTLGKTCTRAIASRRTGSAPRCRHPSAATASKLLSGNHSLYEGLQTFFMLCFDGISHRYRGPCRCSYGLEQRRTRRDSRRPYAATDCLAQSCYSSRLNLRRGERH